jgi:hypothetical protein
MVEVEFRRFNPGPRSALGYRQPAAETINPMETRPIMH